MPTYFAIEQQKKEFTPVSELKQIETPLENLENKLHDFHQVLLRPESRRGLLDCGTIFLKNLFGTATLTDIHSQHELLNTLKIQNSDMSHSLSNQLTYVKKLSTATKLDTEAVTNLSNVIKDHMIMSHDELQQMARHIIWLNVTFFGHSTLHSSIRRLEFTLLQILQQFTDLLDAVQLAIQGTLSIKLINPVVLQNILRNVTLHLPQGYELIAGISIQDIHSYYDLATVSVIANVHCINIVLRIPLKSANRYFALFKIVTLPTYITSDQFAQYRINYAHFGLQHSQLGCILLSEASCNRCKKPELLYVQPKRQYTHASPNVQRQFILSDNGYLPPVSTEVTLQPPNAVPAPLRNVMGIFLSDAASCLSALPQKQRRCSSFNVALQSRHSP
jgi:hypothetical protein